MFTTLLQDSMITVIEGGSAASCLLGADFGIPCTSRAQARYNISHNTLARKHQGLMDSYAGAASARANLVPEQELELVKYIEQLSGEGLSPTRAMIKNFASFLAKKDVSERWVGRFLKKNPGLITNKYVKGMDCNHYKTDSYDKY
jgi:hypothetical protein